MNATLYFDGDGFCRQCVYKNGKIDEDDCFATIPIIFQIDATNIPLDQCQLSRPIEEFITETGYNLSNGKHIV
jgi:hypothetical protein